VKIDFWEMQSLNYVPFILLE